MAFMLKKARVCGSRLAAIALLGGAVFLASCGNPVAGAAGAEPSSPTGQSVDSASAVRGEVVKPPFAVRGELDGLLLVWFDEEGTHTAKRRSEIPEAHRSLVRVDSLALSPQERLGPDQVYLAELSQPDATGQYRVLKVSREQFDKLVDESTAPLSTAGPVVLYKTSWCGACKAAEAHLKQRGIDYDAHDIEKDPAAQREMASKVVAAGQRPGGVPVIDVGGELLMGFDRGALDRLIEQKGLSPNSTL